MESYITFSCYHDVKQYIEKRVERQKRFESYLKLPTISKHVAFIYWSECCLFRSMYPHIMIALFDKAITSTYEQFERWYNPMCEAELQECQILFRYANQLEYKTKVH